MKKLRLFLLPALAALCLPFAACKKSAKEEVAAPETDSAPAEPAEKPRGEEHTLVAKLPTGKEVDEQIEIESKIETTFNGNSQNMENKVTLELAHRVTKELESGGHAVEMELTGKKFEMKAGENVLAWDSANPKSEDGKNPLFKDLRKAVGGTIDYETKADGSLAKLDGYEAFIKRATRSTARSSRGMLATLYGKPAVARMLLTPVGLPDKPVAEGDTWKESKVDVTPAGILQAETTYTFEELSIREGIQVAVISANTVYTKPQAAPQGGGDRSGGEEAGGPGGGPEEMEDGMAAENEARMAEMGGGGAEAPPAGGSPAGGGGGDSGAASGGDGALSLGSGELGKAIGKIYFDMESGMVVEVSGKQLFQVDQSVQNQTLSRKFNVDISAKIVGVKDIPATQ